MGGKIRASGQEVHQIFEPRHGDDRNAVIPLYFLNRGKFTLAAFLAVQCNQYAGRCGAGGTDQLHRLAHRGSGRNNVVNDQHATGQRRTDDAATLAMIFGFLAVEGERIVPAVLGEGDGNRSDQRDAFVSRAEQHVELDVARFGGFCVEFGQTSELIAIVEQACIEKVRRQPTSLGLEFAEAQNLAAHSEFNEILTKIHIFPFHMAEKTRPI